MLPSEEKAAMDLISILVFGFILGFFFCYFVF